MLLAWVVLTNSHSLKIKSWKGWNRTALVRANVLGNQGHPAVEKQVATCAWYRSESGLGNSLTRQEEPDACVCLLALSLLVLPGTVLSYAKHMQWAHTNKQVPKFIPHSSEQPEETLQEICSPRDRWFASWKEWCVSWYFWSYDPSFDPVDPTQRRRKDNYVVQKMFKYRELWRFTSEQQ